MYRDFDDFQDEHEYYRLKHIERLGIEPYGEDYFWYDCDLLSLIKNASVKDPADDPYDLDSLSLKDAKLLFQALGELALYKGFDIKDNPESLYHPNNKTLLNTSTMPDVPVCPQAFSAKVQTELAENGVLISQDMPALIESMCRLFNFSISPNQKLPQSISSLVFPAQTGIGKSVSLQVYVSMLAEHSSVIVVSKVEEAIGYCEYINRLKGDENYARCYYALTDKNKNSPMRVEVSKLEDHMCIVITHNMFRRMNGFDEIDSFRQYQGKSRDFIAIDEKLTFYEQYKISYKELDQLLDNLDEALRCSDELASFISSHEAMDTIRKFKEFLKYKDELIISDDKSIVIQEHLGIDLDADFELMNEKLKFSDKRTGFPKKIVGIKNKGSVSQALHFLGIKMQRKRRNVIGVGFTELAHHFHDYMREIDSYYCDKLDPSLGNCINQVDEQKGITANTIEVDKLMQMLDDENPQTVVYEEPLTMAFIIAEIILKEQLESLIKGIENLGGIKNPIYKRATINKIEELIENLKYFSNNHFLIYKTNYEKAILATTNMVNQLGLSVVLDATSQFNEYYQLANRFLGHVGFVDAPQIRKYENLVIHKAKDFNQSASALFKNKTNEEKVETAKQYISFAISELTDKDDRMLIIGHKGFVPALKKECTDQRIEFTHWGNHVGRNNWSHCNKVMLVGWYYLNPIEYVSTINSALDSILLTSRHLDDELIEKFAISQLADDMVQGLMRSQARVIASNNSDCKPSEFYIFYKDDEKSEKVLELVESQFPQASIKDWKPLGIQLKKKRSKQDEKADEAIAILVEKAKSHQTYLLSDLISELSFSASTMTRILRNEYIHVQLKLHGFSYKSKDGKSKYFILN